MPHDINDGRAGSAAPPALATRRVVLDSRHRDAARDPRPDRYDVQLPDDLEDVVAVRLLWADVPFSAADVDERNRALPLVLLAQPAPALAVLLAPGDYAGPAELASEAERALAAAAPGAGFLVRYLAGPDTFEVSAGVPFGLPFASEAARACEQAPGGAARLLGFSPRRDHASAPDPGAPGRHVLRGDARRADPRDPREYLVLHLSPPAEALTGLGAAHRALARVRRGEPQLPPEHDYVKTWGTPLARVARVGVAFTDRDGRRYDFRGADHVLELEFTHRVAARYAPWC
jgi:hypothetical protein